MLGKTGGKVTAFLSNLPTVGAGALKARDDNALYGTPKEKQLFVPQTPFYDELASKCSEAAVRHECSDVFQNE